ncbi:MAG: hypothetical protein ACKVOE_06010 [Rickettsiales bacterium]
MLREHPKADAPGSVFWERALRHETLDGEPTRRRDVLELKLYAGEGGHAISKLWNALEGLRAAERLPPTMVLSRAGHHIHLRIAGLPVDANQPHAERYAQDALRDAIQATGKMLGMSDRSHDSDIIGYLAHLPEIAEIAQISYRDRKAQTNDR